MSITADLQELETLKRKLALLDQDRKSDYQQMQA